MIYDQKARDTALDPSQSFIIQAPAGSGKTELLTKRFLTLLTKVEYPEEILAVTFTRKAAGEMRHRIISAISNVEKESPLANLVASRNQALEWKLIENPNRLRIMTIDSLCSLIAHQMPLLSETGGNFDIAADPKQLYQAAIERCLLNTTENDPWQGALSTLLLHFDNKVERLKEVLAMLLAKRDQWLVHLSEIQKNPEELENYFENILSDILSRQLEKIDKLIPHFAKESLLNMAYYAGQNCLEESITHPITMWIEEGNFPAPQLENSKKWLALLDLLLTKESQWRKQFNKNVGFLSPSSTKDKNLKILRKDKIDAMLSLVATLSMENDLLESLAELRLLPPIALSFNQVEVLQALGQFLPVLVAFLRLSFQETGKVDFTEVTLSALNALGEELNPTDVILKLDYQIQHILIDEYQDTSVIQYKLFEKLISGWQPHDGRTLFLVGDPMQSIYRFRGAEVNLFLRTKLQGLGSVKLTFLQLKMNFRSNRDIVEWINTQFKDIFPSEIDYTLSAINYSEAIAIHPSATTQSVWLHPLLKGSSSQCNYIVELIEGLIKQNEAQRIAVLVRSRRHLAELIPILKSSQIPFIAHEVEHLAKRPHIMDLLNLLRATNDVTDTVAWLALLRSPLVGLTLNHLLILQKFEPSFTIFQKLKYPKLLDLLDTDAKGRLSQFVERLSYWMNNRHRAPLAHWLRGLWIILGGLKCYSESHLSKDFETFYFWLYEYDGGGYVKDIDAFEEKMDDLYADVIPSGLPQGPCIELMTIHKAKGLEFDNVILPHCQANTRKNSPPLLIWQELATPSGIDLLFASYRALNIDAEPLYDYINHLHKQKEQMEAARLFYVAVSRAKHQIHLVADCEVDDENNPKSAAKGSFWQMLFEDKRMDHPILSMSLQNKSLAKTMQGNLKRLQPNWCLPKPLLERYERSLTMLPKEPNLPEQSCPIFKTIGVVFHRAMQTELYLQPKESWHFSCQLVLKRLGVPVSAQEGAIHTIIQALENVLADPKGQWLVDKNHRERHAEWAISVSLPNGVENIIIDYAFIDQSDIRWIVDYKLVQTTPFSIEAELEHYRSQLKRYTQALKKYENREVRAGLYFPLQKAWIENRE